MLGRNTLLVLLVVFLSACQAPLTHYMQARVDAGQAYVLADNVVNGVWQDMYLTVNYQVDNSADKVSVHGTFSYADHPRAMYNLVQDMKLKFFLLDAQQRVVAYQEVGRALGKGLDEVSNFAATFTKPVTATGFAFGYEGGFIDEDKNLYSVYELPKTAAK